MSKEQDAEQLFDIIDSNIDIDILESNTDAVDYEVRGIRRAINEIIGVGYRKADEVRKETIGEVLQYVFDPDCYDHLDDLCEEKGWGFTEAQRDRIFEHFEVNINDKARI